MFSSLTTLLALPGVLLFWWMMHKGLVDQSLGTAGAVTSDEVADPADPSSEANRAVAGSPPGPTPPDTATPR